MQKILVFTMTIIILILGVFVYYLLERNGTGFIVPEYYRDAEEIIVFESEHTQIVLKDDLITYTNVKSGNKKGIRFEEAILEREKLFNKSSNELPLIDVHFDVGLLLKGETMEYLIEILPEFDLLASYPTIRHTGKYILIDKSDNSLYLYTDSQLEKHYETATGKLPTYTPEGTFSIASKILGPGQDKSQLGSAWLGLSVPSEYDKRGPDGDERAPAGLKYGIHGTDEPGSIGTYVTGGCVRLSNDDILDLYHRVGEGTPVEIRL